MLFKKKSYEEELLKKYGKCKEIKKSNLKILFVADTHDCIEHDNETQEVIKQTDKYNYCILLGDHSANDLNYILKIIPKEKVFGILGNHDSWEKYDEFEIENIDGKIKIINNKKIAGISGSFKYKDSNNYALYTHEESIEIAEKMGEADILISHDKPFLERKYGDAHDGLKGVTLYLYKNKIPIHIHGHIHQESENILKNGTKSFCLYKAKILEI